MTTQTKHNRGNEPPTEATLTIPIPALDPSLYRYGATNEILRILVDNPYTEFTARELSRVTDYSLRSITQASDVLSANDLIHTRAEGNRKPIRINRARLSKPDDPVLQLPQAEFHQPVRAAVDQLGEQLDDVHGIVVFGSVARGEADRQSDIDLFVLVAEAQATNQRWAHEIAKQLGQQRFTGDRYEFEVLVESVTSARQYGERLGEIFAGGLTLYTTDTLAAVKREVLTRD
jgi:predicted nucleotidyltransferase